MVLTNDPERIKRAVKEFFEKADFEVEIKVLPAEDSAIFVKIKTEEPKVLIGQGGQTLMEIQRLLKAVLRRRIGEGFYLNIDINDYKKKKEDYLKEIARSLADEVALDQKEKALDPMPAFERRIIHMALSDRSDVVAESAGEEPDRRIVIKPKARF